MSRFSGDPQSSEGTWERLSQVAVKGAVYDSPERQPHPKCLQGTRVDLLNFIHKVSDNREKSQLIWLHGTAGVGKSAVAFTVAEKMRGLKVTEQTIIEKRLAGSFFFSRKHTNRCTTGYFFATLAYQLAINFPSVRTDVSRAVGENPALLDPNNSLRQQMDALFLRPLRKLHIRLRGCPPLSFVVDALDECTSETELVDLISLLGQALREPDLPVIHILLTSRSEAHIREAMQEEEVYPLVCEIPVKTSGDGVASIISLDGADVDNDIYIYLEHSFRKLRDRCSDFPQPTRDELVRLASRAGRRFIVASTMMKFIDDGYHDPRDRLQLMLDLTCELLPGTEVYKLYDRILSTCADPIRAHLHLSVVAALTNPLSISQISKLLGPGQGKDVETTLIQLRSIMDIPADSSLPVNIYHSSVRDYVSDPSNCSLPQVPCIMPHSLIACSCFRLMIQDIPENVSLLDRLSELKRQSEVVPSYDPHELKKSLAFITQPPEPLQVLICLLWLRGHHRLVLQDWIKTMGGRAWRDTLKGHSWLFDKEVNWRDFMHSQAGRDWLLTQSGRDWLLTKSGRDWLGIRDDQGSLSIQGRRDWPTVQAFRGWLWARRAGDSLRAQGWIQTQDGRDWLQTEDGRIWLQIQCGRTWLRTQGGQSWLQDQGGREWLRTQGGREWLRTQDGEVWLKTQSGRDWLETKSGLDWLQTQGGEDWLKTKGGEDWLQTQEGQDWLQTPHGRASPWLAVWATMGEFSSTLEAINEYAIAPEWRLLPAFQAIQRFKSLPDFLMFPVFLALRHQDYLTCTPPQGDFPDMEVIHAMKAFGKYANETWGRSQSASDALKYACQHWAVHLSRAPNTWDATFDHVFKSFWNRHLLTWLEMQWRFKGLRSCLTILSEGEKLAKEHLQAQV